MMRPALLALAIVGTPAAAQEGPQAYLADGKSIETELRADFNGDGVPDLAYVTRRGEEVRELRVATTFINDVEIGDNPVQVLGLDPYPLGDATLKVKDKVLVLQDLTGGTTAVFSTHRFRWDPKLQAMRLIGLDATLYSRTFAHDGAEASWNLLTGDLITRTLKLTAGPGNQAYDTVGEKRVKKRSKPLKLEDTPSGDDLLGWPDGQ